MEKVSVIVPVYKVEKYLDRCMESIVGQTYRNMEILLVDDGSPDSCPRICDEWGKRDPRIKVIHKENGGLSSARNEGIAIAKGDYIAFVDSDDYIDPNMIEIMLEAARRYDAEVVACGRKRVGRSRISISHALQNEKVFTSEEAIKEILQNGAMDEAAWDKLYRREILEDRRFPEGEINEDIVLMIKILGSSKRIVHVGKALYYYCENEGSITRSGYDTNKAVIVKHLEQVKEYVEDNYAELIPYYYMLALRYSQGALYLILDHKKTYLKYRRDYKKFYKIFIEAYRRSIFSDHVSVTEKAKGLLIVLGIYLPLHEIRARGLSK